MSETDDPFESQHLEEETPPAEEPKKRRRGRLPKVGTKKAPSDPAAAILLAREKVRADEAVKEAERLNADYIWYMRCPRHADHMAIYFTEKPGPTIHPGMWFSLEHQAGEPWLKPAVQCQECLVNGDPSVWLWLAPRQMPDGNFSFTFRIPPETKAVFSIARAELEEKLGGKLEEVMAAELEEA